MRSRAPRDSDCASGASQTNGVEADASNVAAAGAVTVDHWAALRSTGASRHRLIDGDASGLAPAGSVKRCVASFVTVELPGLAIVVAAAAGASAIRDAGRPYESHRERACSQPKPSSCHPCHQACHPCHSPAFRCRSALSTAVSTFLTRPDNRNIGRRALSPPRPMIRHESHTATRTHVRRQRYSMSAPQRTRFPRASRANGEDRCRARPARSTAHSTGTGPAC